MPKIITIIGARPQFIKAAAICRAIRNNSDDRLIHKIIHSGQHYDDNMSGVFFDELEIPKPDFNLGVGSGRHGYQTAEMIRKVEKVLLEENPGMIIVYGDTNTTLAGALAASKLHIPVVHIEAGLRSFNKSMPEEINRVITDHVSTFLFSPTRTGYNNLIREGFDPGNKPPFSVDHPAVFHCGDVMLDNALYYSEIAEKKSAILERLNLKGKEFILFTLHRENNTDSGVRLKRIIGAIDAISREMGISCVLPLHPRTKKVLEDLAGSPDGAGIGLNPLFRIISPLSYFDMLVLEKNCRMVITDSGGVQKESYFFRKPCLVLRQESEWKELVETGSAVLVDDDPNSIRKSFLEFHHHPPQSFPALFGDGKASEFILGEIVKFLPSDLQG